MNGSIEASHFNLAGEYLKGRKDLMGTPTLTLSQYTQLVQSVAACAHTLDRSMRSLSEDEMDSILGHWDAK